MWWQESERGVAFERVVEVLLLFFVVWVETRVYSKMLVRRSMPKISKKDEAFVQCSSPPDPLHPPLHL